MNVDLLKADLERDEGRVHVPYRDSLGVWTVGVGRNMQRPFSDSVIDLILEEDIEAAISDLDRNIPWWAELPEPAARALCNMSYQMGWPRLSGFKKMLKALSERDFEAAAHEALDSEWQRQTPERAGRIAKLFKEAKGT